MLLRLAILFSSFIFPDFAAYADFKDTLAAKLAANAVYLVVNIPPRPGAWPGAIFTYNLRLPIKYGDPNDPALKRGEPISIQAEGVFDASVKADAAYSFWSFWITAAAKAGDAADVVMTFPDARIVDMKYDELVHHIETCPGALEAAKRGQIPLIVVKAYEGTPTVTITRKAGVSAEAWAKVPKAALEVGAESSVVSKDQVIYRAGAPTVFAFETSQVLFDLHDLATGKVTITLAELGKNTITLEELGKNTITLAALPAQVFAMREQASDVASTTSKYFTVAAGGLSPIVDLYAESKYPIAF